MAPPVEPYDLSGLTIGRELNSGAYLATDGVKKYLVEPPTANNPGRKRWITSTPVFDQFGFNGNVQTVNPLVLATMPCGPDLAGRLGPPTTTCNAPVVNITMYDQPGKMVLYCNRDPRLTSPGRLSLTAQTPNAPQPLSVTGSDTTLSLIVPADYFPYGDYQLTATCITSGIPPLAATLSLSSSQVPMTLRATPSSGLQLAITCANPEANGIHAVAYPASAGPNSPDTQTFDAPAGQSTLQATYRRRANYDVRVDCSLGGGPIHTLTVPDSTFPLPLTIRIGGQNNVFLYCDRELDLTSPATFSLAAQTPNAPPPLSVSGTGKDSRGTISLTVPTDYFPNGDYQLSATCASTDTPPFTAAPLTLSSSQVPRTLRATPSSGLRLVITSVNQQANGIHAVAYPASAGPNSSDARTFDAPVGQSMLQATYSRRANYDVGVDWSLGGGSINTLTVPAGAFPPPLTIRADRQDRWLYCDRDLQLTSPATLSLAAQIPNPPPPLSENGVKTIVLTVLQDYFPAGDYQLTATCASSDTPPFTATPLTLSSSQIPTQKVSAKITGCSAQGGNAYACALQVTLGGPLAVNTVFHVGIGGGGFANPSGGDRPQVPSFARCQVAPLPSPYYPDPGNGGYDRYDVNISTGGCTADAVVTFGEAVTGAAKATITQPVTVPGLGASMATFVLP